MTNSTHVCPHCSPPVVLKPKATYCHRCGRIPARIEWTLSSQPEGDLNPITGMVPLVPGGCVYLIGHNTGMASVAVQVEINETGSNPKLESASHQVVNGGKKAVFILRCGEGEIDVVLTAYSADGRRTHWWEQKSSRHETFLLKRRIAIKSERWMIGSPRIVFPIGMQKQRVTDTLQKRIFDTPVPHGYELRYWSAPAEQFMPEQDYSCMLEIDASVPEADREQEWCFPSSSPIPLQSLSEEGGNLGPAMVIAIDFGTRNTSVRVRWRRGAAAVRKPEPEPVGDQDGEKRFPTEMVLSRDGTRELIGSKAAQYIRLGQVSQGEIGVQNLKTLLRTGEQSFIAENPEWTTERLLEIYFTHLFRQIDEYLRTALPNRSVNRTSQSVQYVLTRPVLDYNEGDQAGKRYEAALTVAVQKQHPDADIVFVLEPVAAANSIARLYKEELLKLKGKAICVIDAGGGTTDIALARVTVDRGHVVLEPIRAYDLTLSDKNWINSAFQHFHIRDQRHFGGNALDAALAFMLRTDAQKVLDSDSGSIPDKITQTADSEFMELCRREKEKFEIPLIRPYLNYTAPPGETVQVPFANVPEYEGVYLAHDLYNANLLGLILPQATETVWRAIASHESGLVDRILPIDVRETFCVGGTNVDSFVRSRLVSTVSGSSLARNLDTRLNPEERMNAVIEGAVWHGEAPYVSSPFTLFVECQGKRKQLLSAGEPLPEIEDPLPFDVELNPDEPCDAKLLVSGTGLEGEVCVAHSMYRNLTQKRQVLTLRAGVTRTAGARAILETMEEDNLGEQWHFLLREDQQ